MVSEDDSRRLTLLFCSTGLFITTALLAQKLIAKSKGTCIRTESKHSIDNRNKLQPNNILSPEEILKAHLTLQALDKVDADLSRVHEQLRETMPQSACSRF